MSNVVPEGWASAELTKFCEVVGGGTPDRSVEEYWNGDIPWASPTEITSRFSKYISKTKECISRKGLERSSAKLHPAGTVLMTSRASIGYVAINTVPMATNQGFQSLRCKDHALADYIYQYVTWIRPELEKMSAGSTFSEISSSSVKKLRVTLPPLPEQQTIADILSSVDGVIEKTRAQIDKLKDLKTGMMQELLTKGIGHTEFKDSLVGRIPVSWKIQSLKSLSRRITDGTHQSVKTSDSGKIPFLYVSCIRNGEILWDKASGLTESDYKLASKGRVASPGDILYTAVGSYGHAALVEIDQRFSFQRHIAFIQPDKSIVDPRYLVSVLNSTLGRTQADRFAIGNAQLTVTLGDLGTFMIPTPPIHEQNKIAQAISRIVSNIREHETKLDSLLNLKKALMQDLLTGKVRVNVDQKESAVA